jgi:DNA-binding winged helix-turn-helix (wHTH) protein
LQLAAPVLGDYRFGGAVTITVDGLSPAVVVNIVRQKGDLRPTDVRADRHDGADGCCDVDVPQHVHANDLYVDQAVIYHGDWLGRYWRRRSEQNCRAQSQQCRQSLCTGEHDLADGHVAYIARRWHCSFQPIEPRSEGPVDVGSIAASRPIKAPRSRSRSTRQEVIDAMRDQTPERIQAWAVEIGGQRFPLAQVWACATTEPRSSYTTSTACSIFERLGFRPFHIRQPVTYHSTGHDDAGVVAPREPAPVQQVAPQPQDTDTDQAALLERLSTVTAERDWLRERVERAELVCEQLRTLLSNAQQSLVRALQAAPRPSELMPGPLQVGPLTIDRSRCTATVGGVPIHLTPTEYRLLCALADPPNRVHLLTDLEQQVWADPSPTNTRSLQVHIRRLRGKLNAGPLRPLKLTTVRGIGYRLETPSTNSEEETQGGSDARI